MLMLALVGNILLLIVVILTVVDAYQNEGALHALLVLVLPFYGIYYLLVKMVSRKGTVIFLWVLGMVLLFAPHVPAVANLVSGSDECALLSPEDIKQELGLEISGSKPAEARHGKACVYSVASQPDNGLVLRVTECDARIISAMKQMDGAFPVSDLGEDAVSTGGELWTRQGSECRALFREKKLGEDDSLQGRKHLLAKTFEKRGSK